MAVPVIKGALGRRAAREITIALSLASVAGFGWWYGYKVPHNKAIDAFYAKQK